MTAVLSWLTGRRCEGVVLDFWVWRFDFGGAELKIECPWRILAAGRIAVTDYDHGKQFGLPRPVDAALEARERLGQRSVQSVHLGPESGDLTLDFGDGVRLEVWNSSSGHEAWTAHGPDGELIVATGGSELAVWGPRSRGAPGADENRA